MTIEVKHCTRIYVDYTFLTTFVISTGDNHPIKTRKAGRSKMGDIVFTNIFIATILKNMFIA